MTDSNIRTAVDAWLANPTAAEATYGHISTWETGGVTDMEELFEDASSFNEDIGEWDISGVTTMEDMFRGASAFDQDLDWCVDDDVDLDDAFDDTPCESTSCGVKQGALEENGNCQSTGALGSDGAAARSAALCHLLCLIFLGAALAYGEV